jgi:glycosyltransferase involved in cell wall biosynthesis
MRIGVDIRSLLSPTGHGVSHYTSALLRNMVRLYPDDTWLLLQTGARRFSLPAGLDAPNVTLRHVRVPNRLGNLALFSGVAPGLDRLLGGVDVFFAPNFGFVRLGSRTPYVLTVHDLSFRVDPSWYTARERIWHRAVRPRRLVRGAARVIAVSEQTRLEIERVYGVSGERVRVIHPGIDHAGTLPLDEAALERVAGKYALPLRYVLFLGAQMPRKNVGFMLEGYRRARERGLESELVLAGDVSPALDRYGTTHPEAPLHQVGYVLDADRPAIYGGATALMFVSHHEGFGFPPLEALAAGTPSVVSDLAVFDETLGSAALRVDGDAGLLADRLLQLERDPALRAGIVGDAEAIVGRFDWDRAAAETHEVLHEAAAFD